MLRILESRGDAGADDRTITDPEAFLAELEEIRGRGYAIDNGENEEGGRCVAVPLALAGVRAAISLSAPAVRFTLEQSSPRSPRH